MLPTVARGWCCRRRPERVGGRAAAAAPAVGRGVVPGPHPTVLGKGRAKSPPTQRIEHKFEAEIGKAAYQVGHSPTVNAGLNRSSAAVAVQLVLEGLASVGVIPPINH
jgi:hypothetical protein